MAEGRLKAAAQHAMVYLASPRAAIGGIAAMVLLRRVASARRPGLLGSPRQLRSPRSQGTVGSNVRRRTGQVFLSAALALAALALPALTVAQEGNAEEGAEVFKKCRACHDVGPGAKNKVGPVLNDIVGRKAGTIEGFPYSDANKSAGGKGLVWTEDVLFKYLENPLSFMPGTKMAFAGLKDPQDRKDIIAYLKKYTK